MVFEVHDDVFGGAPPSGHGLREREEAEPPRLLRTAGGRSWREPPRPRVLPAALPWRRFLADAAEARIALSGVWVWPESFTLDLVVFARTARPERSCRLTPFPCGRHGGTDGSRTRVLISFADGRTARQRGPRPLLRRPGQPDAPPDHPVVRADPGEGGPFHCRQSAHVWPLPPEGPLSLAVHWPELGIPPCTTELSGTDIRAAAAHALAVWSDSPPTPPTGSGGRE